MITLEQAQRLRDAGYEQFEPNITEMWYFSGYDEDTYDYIPTFQVDDDAPAWILAPNSDELIAAIQAHPRETIEIGDVVGVGGSEYSLVSVLSIIGAASMLWAINYPNKPFELLSALVDLYCKLAETE